MRIIAGDWRSRRLVRPQTPQTRPMPDRVKTAIFNMLGAYYDLPGRIPPLCVADVFAGSGSMGLEALSRGAKSCCFFERQRIALDALKENIENLNAHHQATIVTRDAWRAALLDENERPFDLVLLDPPYKDTEDRTDQGAVKQYLRRLAEVQNVDTLVVLHHQAPKQLEFDSDGPWRVLDFRIFGTNAVTMIAR